MRKFLSTYSLPILPSFLHRFSSFNNIDSFLVKSSTLFTSNVSPLSSLINEDCKPNMSDPTTGTSQALDSMTVFPKPSLLLGRQKIFEILKISSGLFEWLKIKIFSAIFFRY